MSSLVLNLDILTQTLSPKKIHTIFIGNPEDCLSIYSQESWIVTLCRLEDERNLRIVALSQEPEAIRQRGNIDKIMRHFYLRHCHFWPSFRVEVQSFLMGEPDGFQTFQNELLMSPSAYKIEDVNNFQNSSRAH